MGKVSNLTLERAVRWYREHRSNIEGPIIVALRERFDLDAKSAVAVVQKVQETDGVRSHG